jgi:hypothetical protein
MAAGMNTGCSGGSSATEISSSSSKIDRLSVRPTVSVGSLPVFLGPIEGDWFGDDAEEDDGADGDDGEEAPAAALTSAEGGT